MNEQEMARCLRGKRIGFAVTGSFCTFERAFAQAARLTNLGALVQPIMSEHAYEWDTRFMTAEEARRRLSAACGERPIWHTVAQVEPIGPKRLLDLLIIAPLTGNTAAKLALGATDTAVAMAAKAQMRTGGPVLLAISTNDGLSGSARNIGALHAARGYYFVPYGQDDPEGKPASLVAHLEFLPQAAVHALQGEQMQPILCGAKGRGV